jgi:hypothetical protein
MRKLLIAGVSAFALLMSGAAYAQGSSGGAEKGSGAANSDAANSDAANSDTTE